MTFDAAPSAMSTIPLSINSRGDVTGRFIDGAGVQRGFIRSRQGATVIFDADPAATSTSPQSINARGEVAGSFEDGSMGTGPRLRSTHSLRNRFHALVRPSSLLEQRRGSLTLIKPMFSVLTPASGEAEDTIPSHACSTRSGRGATAISELRQDARRGRGGRQDQRRYSPCRRLGWSDAGCMGSDLYVTPNIDKLAADGMRFQTSYAACTVCSPSHAAISRRLSGRTHVTDWIRGHQRPYAKLLPPDWTMKIEQRHTTIAEAMKAGGYHTAIVGKWHLEPTGEPDMDDYTPEKHGFEINVAGNEWGAPATYYYPYTREGSEHHLGPMPPDDGHEGEYLTDRLTDEALKILDGWGDQPFFSTSPTTPCTRRPKPRKTTQRRSRSASRKACGIPTPSTPAWSPRSTAAWGACGPSSKRWASPTAR